MTTTSILTLIAVFFLGFFFPLGRSTTKGASAINKSDMSDKDIHSCIFLGFVVGYRQGFRDSTERKINQFGHLDGFKWFTGNLKLFLSGHQEEKPLHLSTLTAEDRKKLILDFQKEIFQGDPHDPNAEDAFLVKVKQKMGEAMASDQKEENIKQIVSASVLLLSNIHIAKSTSDAEQLQREQNTITEVFKAILENAEEFVGDTDITKSTKIDTLRTMIAVSPFLADPEIGKRSQDVLNKLMD